MYLDKEFRIQTQPFPYMSLEMHPENQKPSYLERFGIYYLDIFKRLKTKGCVNNLSDAEVKKYCNKVILKGIILSSLIGIICVSPTIWLDIYLQNEPFWTRYGIIALATIMSIGIELYFLFLISLRIVHEISHLVRFDHEKIDFLKEGIFSVKSILARTALELPDPELSILGIDPFKRVSKKNLFIIGLIYKAKIFLTNWILKRALYFSSGQYLFGINILYAALPVECFWNGVVVKRIVNEARLRLFGFALAEDIIQNLEKSKYLEQLSPEAQQGCMRAIGNAVVMTQNYHPNMIVLLVSFQQTIGISEGKRYDDWKLFLETLSVVSEKERFFLLDLFTVAVAFDGKISRLELENLKAAYGTSFDIYYHRVIRLTENLRLGHYHEAKKDCRINFTEG